MEGVFSQLLDFMQTQTISFEFVNTTYSFTFWDLTIAILVIDVGIFIVRKAVGD